MWLYLSPVPWWEEFWGVFYLKRPCGAESWLPVGGLSSLWLWSWRPGPSSSSLSLAPTASVTPTLHTHARLPLTTPRKVVKSSSSQMCTSLCVCVCACVCNPCWPPYLTGGERTVAQDNKVERDKESVYVKRHKTREASRKERLNGVVRNKKWGGGTGRDCIKKREEVWGRW